MKHNPLRCLISMRSAAERVQQSALPIAAVRGGLLRVVRGCSPARWRTAGYWRTSAASRTQPSSHIPAECEIEITGSLDEEELVPLLELGYYAACVTSEIMISRSIVGM